MNSLQARPPPDPDRIARTMRRNAVFGIVAGASIVGAALLAVLQGRSFSGPSLLFVILAAGMLVVSVRLLMPSYSRQLIQRITALEATSHELRNQRTIRLNRKVLLVLAVVFSVEVLIAFEVWPLREWQSWIAAMLGVTLMLVVLVSLITVRAKMGRY